MINIYHCTIQRELTSLRREEYFALLPPAEKEKNVRFRRWEDRHAHLFGRMLLRQGLLFYGYKENILEDIRLNPYNRPFLWDGIDFSISHSGEYVTCAIGEGFRLGMDVERKNPQFDPEDAGAIFCDAERTYIRGSDNRCNAFFRLWARKESLIKADGRGFSAPLTSINSLTDEVVLDNQRWYVQDLILSEAYSSAISTDQADPELNMIAVDFY
jgi:4'-phosphopantetheinyl transferase